MKLRNLFRVALMLGACHCSFAKKTESAPKIPEQELKYKLLTAVLKLGDTPLPKQKGCENFSIHFAKKPPTFNEWVSWSLSFFDSGVTNSVTVRIDIGKDKLPLYSIDFNADSTGESPWSCGFRFRIDSKLERIDLSSLECIGSC